MLPRSLARHVVVPDATARDSSWDVTHTPHLLRSNAYRRRAGQKRGVIRRLHAECKLVRHENWLCSFFLLQCTVGLVHQVSRLCGFTGPAVCVSLNRNHFICRGEGFGYVWLHGTVVQLNWEITNKCRCYDSIWKCCNVH
jgi:hypothetical protein